jgi:hypothetical protein
MTLNCFKCHAEVVFDSEHIGKNGKKIPLDPATHSPHDCPMREKKQIASGHELDWGPRDAVPVEDKDDHGNEDTGPRLLEESPRFVDHTAKGQSKVKIFYAPGTEVLEEQYNNFLKINNGQIKVQGGQFQIRDGGFAIALYYEETK